MTARTSIWRPFYPDIPTQASYLPIDILRRNIVAVQVAESHGFARMWNYTNSVTRAEASPGTALAPARKYWKRGSGNATKWVKQVCTYTGANLTKVALYYSEDNEATYVPMLDADNNYVLTLTYDGSNNLTSTTWGNTP